MKKTLAALLLAAPLCATAQLAPTAPGGVSPGPTHMAAALDVARTLRLDLVLETTISNMEPPGLRREIARRIVLQRVDVKGFEALAARVYAEIFTEPELRQLATFYQSDVGRKLQANTPTLQRRMTETLLASRDTLMNLAVSGCAAAAVGGAADQAARFQTSLGKPAPSLEEVLQNLEPMLAKAEASCTCILGKAFSVAKSRDLNKIMNEPEVRAAVEESVRTGACPRPN